MDFPHWDVDVWTHFPISVSRIFDLILPVFLCRFAVAWFPVSTARCSTIWSFSCELQQIMIENQEHVVLDLSRSRGHIACISWPVFKFEHLCHTSHSLRRSKCRFCKHIVACSRTASTHCSAAPVTSGASKVTWQTAVGGFVWGSVNDVANRDGDQTNNIEQHLQ